MMLNEIKEKKYLPWIRILFLLVIVSAITYVFYRMDLLSFFLSRKRLIHFLDSLGPVAFLGFILLQVAHVVVAPVPGEITVLLGVYLYGSFLGVLLSTIGLTIGSYVAFAFSRFFGRPFVEKFVKKSLMERFDYFFHKKGAFLAFMLFAIPGFPKDYLCFLLGIGHISTTEFLVITGTGRLLSTAFLTLGGSYLKNHQYQRFSMLMGIVTILVFLAMAYKNKLKFFSEMGNVKQKKW